VLDVHREAIYYLKPEWQASVIFALILVGSENSDASFIESLAFYLEKEKSKKDFLQKIMTDKNIDLDFFKSCLIKLEDDLRKSGDGDMAEVFFDLRILLEA
jgi:hypothetical protein